MNNKVGASPVAYWAVGEVPTTRRRLHRCSFSHGLFREPYQVSSARAFRRASTANRLNDNFKALIVKDENIFPNGITEKKNLFDLLHREYDHVRKSELIFTSWERKLKAIGRCCKTSDIEIL